ncbi:MAG: GrpB family protein [Candidatus Heimdallarchaeota archaeon]|nr:GrpB family protein [Candidatus Heimdallarchaeota archaeon]
MRTLRTIVVEDYNPEWKDRFEEFKQRYEVLLGKDYIEILHVGSTSVVGLAAKPIIDMVIVIKAEHFESLKNKLKTLGYIHNGDQGIPGREAFRLPPELKDKWFPHHLYVCNKDADELIRYRAFLSYLNKYPEVRDDYSKIKKEAAALYPQDIEGYMDHKGEFIAEHLTKALNEWGYTKDHTINNCPECLKVDLRESFEIKYDKGGMKYEYFTFQCLSCLYSWTIRID